MAPSRSPAPPFGAVEQRLSIGTETRKSLVPVLPLLSGFYTFLSGASAHSPTPTPAPVSAEAIFAPR